MVVTASSKLRMMMILHSGAVRGLHYLTCRHTYESTLITELARQGYTADVGSPCAAVARLECDPDELVDPVYALQILPNAREVRGASIKALADGAAAALGAAPGSDANNPAGALLSAASRGSLETHTLVPDMLRGVPLPKAKLLRRCETVAEKLNAQLKRRFPAARARRPDDNGGPSPGDPHDPLLLQLLLLGPELLVVSLAPSTAHRSGIGYWPVRARGGFVDTSLEGDVPSSAYRKLLESFEMMHVAPRAGNVCVDLGACPGGWTEALRRCGARVTAVDRAPLAPKLMADPDVTFVQGDAFVFAPEGGRQVDWMVSDVAAFPERAVELVDAWARQKWARHMVVTMKFTGDVPDFEAVDEAQAAAGQHGYHFRAMHHFSNKNECTLMLSEQRRTQPRDTV